jgi:hypothetical protein
LAIPKPFAWSLDLNMKAKPSGIGTLQNEQNVCFDSGADPTGAF